MALVDRIMAAEYRYAKRPPQKEYRFTTEYRVDTLLQQVDDLPDIVLSDWNTLDVDDMSYIKNKPNVPILDLSGLIPASYLPSYVDDILEYQSFHDLPQPGEPGKIYVTTDNDLTYRWSGTTYVEISKSIITGVKGDAEVNYRIGNVNLTAANIGLGNVVNLDLSKAIKGITRNGLTFTYTCLDGTTGTFDQQDNNTTYSAGTGLLLTNTAFSVKLGYTTSGNNRAVQADTNGNLYVTQKDNDTTYSAGTGLSLTDTTFALALTKKLVTDALGYTPPTTDTNTHRPILLNGTEILGNNTTALNLKAGSNVTLTNSSGTVTIASTDTNTWRGIQDNLTSSTNTTESLSAKLGYLLANGSARDATKLPLTGGTISNGSSWATIGFSRTGTGSGSVGGIDGNGLYFSHINSDGSKSINMYLKAGDGLRVGGNLVWNSGNDGSGSSLDADLLDGAHASYFVGGKLYGSKALTTKQWYRILDVVTYPTSFLLTFGPRYNNNEPTSVTFLILHSYNHVNILQIGAAPVGGVISEVRAIFHDTFKMYIEFYYNQTSNLQNTVQYTVIPLTEITRGNISLVDFTTGSGTAAASCTTSTLVRSDISYRLSHSALTEDNCVPTNYDSMQSFRCTTSTTGYNDGYILAWRYSSGNYVSLLFADVDATYGLCYRYRASNGTWGSWKKVAFTSDLSSYLPLSGGTISGQLDVTGAINTDSYINCTNLNAIDDVTISKGTGAARLRISNAGVLNANNVIEFSQDNSGNTKHFQLQDRMDSGNTRRYFSIWGYNYGSLISASCASGSSYCCVGIGGGSSFLWDTTAKLYVNGNAKASAWNTTSDIRLKDVKGNTDISIETIANAPLFYFYWKDKLDENKHVGTSAQYWLEVLPEVVSGTDESKFTVDYGVTALTSAVTVAREVVKQDKKIKLLEEENKQLKEELLLLKSQINDILTTINKSTNNE